MARAKERPIADPHAGAAKFAEHLARILAGRSLNDLGWKNPNALTLVIPAVAHNGDEYTVKLDFRYYAEWPPSVTFVNPETLQFDGDADLYWVPKVEGDSGFHLHPKYNDANFSGQLVCCSFAAEFYLMLHPVNPEHVWDCERFNFAATIHRINRALSSSYYKGRFAAEPPARRAA